MALALAHVIGALAALIVFSLLTILLQGWEQSRVAKRRLQDASIALGVPVASIEGDESVFPRLLHYSSQRYSGELLRNRLSDLCGGLRTVWGWFSTLVQAGIIIGVSWAMYEHGSQEAPYMWSVLGAAVFCWFVSMVFSFSCLLLTGRYPGEAKAARKSITEFIEQRNHAATASVVEDFS